MSFEHVSFKKSSRRKPETINLPNNIHIFKQKSPDLKTYITHGYRAIHPITKKSKCVTTSIDNELTDEMLTLAKNYLLAMFQEYNGMSPCINIRDRYKSEQSKDLPRYINYHKRKSKDNKTIVLHGYRVRYIPSGKCKVFMIPISKDLTESLLIDAKNGLNELIIDYNYNS